jgi:predicted HTH domain antitoxin
VSFQRCYLAVKYFQEETLTIGKAAELADMNRYDDIQADLAKMKSITRAAL